MRNRWGRTIVASVGVLALFIPLCLLLNNPTPATSEFGLYTESEHDQSVPVEIPGAAYLGLGGSNQVHRLRLVTRDVGRLAAHSQIRFLVANYETERSFEGGELAIVGTRCVYRTIRGARFPNNNLLTFVRGSDCFPLRGAPTGNLRLTLKFTMPGRAALWTFVPPIDIPISATAVVVADPNARESPARPIARGTVVDSYPLNSQRRVQLLGYLWQLSRSTLWIWLVIATNSVFMFVGLYSLASAAVDTRRLVGRRVAGAFFVAIALSLTYAVVVPPFQAADEPSHFAAFGALVGRTDIQEQAGHWAQVGHFERIQFHPDEHFNPSHMMQPGAFWNDGSVPDQSARGRAVEWLWRIVAPFTRTLAVPQLLLALRAVNAVTFGIAVAAFVCLVILFTDIRWPELAAAPIFLVPTLPFFGMQISNYGLLACCYVVLAAGGLIAFWDGPKSSAAGPLIGAAWTVGILVSRSAIPMAPFIGSIFVARILLGNRGQHFGPALIHWVGLGLVMGIGLAIAEPQYLQALSDIGRVWLPAPWSEVTDAVRRRPWLLGVAGVAIAGVEFVISRIAKFAFGSLGSLGPRIVAAVAGTLAVATALLLAGSAILRYPVLAPISPAHPPLGREYIRSAIAAGSTMFRFAHPDHLTSVTFWGGFGWLDTLPSEAFVCALAGASGMTLVALMVWICRSGSVRALTWLACVLVGFVLSVGAYAWSVVRVTPADLHGRYLMGLYLCLLVVTWNSVPRLLQGDLVASRGVRAGIILALCSVLVHGYCLGVILQRYF